VLTRDDLIAALAAIRVSAPVRADEVTGSTNATALAMAEDGAPAWTLVAAGHQSDGRGRLGRTWTDVPGRAVLVSVLLRPALPPARLGLLSLAAGAAVAEAIREQAGVDAEVKWPNDVRVGDRKVGGVLAEASVADERVRHVVVGVGVNLEAPPGVEGAAGIGDVGARRLLIAFLTRLYALVEGEDAQLPGRVRSAWLPVSGTIGRIVEATTADGRRVRGRAFGLDDFGGLLVSTDDGERRVAFGEVEHLAELP
jgi:BirA family biotin operon repressor/biotin-[acetyl-CoA-carboxylase] ligase